MSTILAGSISYLAFLSGWWWNYPYCCLRQTSLLISWIPSTQNVSFAFQFYSLAFELYIIDSSFSVGSSSSSYKKFTMSLQKKNLKFFLKLKFPSAEYLVSLLLLVKNVFSLYFPFSHFLLNLPQLYFIFLTLIELLLICWDTYGIHVAKTSIIISGPTLLNLLQHLT